MIGKIIGVIIVLGIVAVGAIMLLRGESPIDFIKDIISPSSDNISSANTNSFMYEYNIAMGSPVNKNYRFNVAINIVNRSSNEICYEYKITSISQGNPDFIRGFMASYQEAYENQPICVNTSVEEPSPRTHLASPETTFTKTAYNNGATAKYSFKNGVLRSLELEYKVDTGTASNVPVKLTVKLATPNTKTSQATQPTTQTNNTVKLSSENVKTLIYKYTWETTIPNTTSNQQTQQVLEYNIRVDIVNRSNEQACLKYTITNITKGNHTIIQEYMQQAYAGYSENQIVCTNIHRNGPQQIPYYLFDPTITGSKTFTGNNLHGEIGIQNGILTSLQIKYYNQVTDQQGNTITIPTTITVTLLQAK